MNEEFSENNVVYERAVKTRERELIAMIGLK